MYKFNENLIIGKFEQCDEENLLKFYLSMHPDDVRFFRPWAFTKEAIKKHAQETHNKNAISYIANLSVVGLPGLMSIIFIIMLMQSALNEDIRRNCELFHRSQPVSIWLRTGSKFCVGLIGNWIVLFLISLFTFIVINIFLATIHQFNFYVTVSGMLQALTAFIKTGLIIGSLAFSVQRFLRKKLSQKYFQF